MHIFSSDAEFTNSYNRLRAGFFCGLLLALFVFLFSFFVVLDVQAEDWVSYCRYGDFFYYDSATVTRPYENFKSINCVRQKIVYEANSVKRIAAHLGPKYAHLKESISMIEIDCLTRKAQIKSTTFYDSRGMEIESSSKTRPDWKLITRESPPLDILYKIICPPEDNRQ